MSFKSILIGQDSVREALNRYMIKENLPDTLLFLGTSGTGKTFFAENFAEDWLCMNKINNLSCGKCQSCLTIKSNSNPDFREINVDGNSIKLKTVKEIQDYSLLQPVNNKRKILIVNDIDKLTIEAANALLKILEEPNSSTSFILTSKRPEMVIKTIQSRAIKLRFKPYTKIEIKKIIQDEELNDIDLISSLAIGSCKRAIFLCNKENFERRHENCKIFISLLLGKNVNLIFSKKTDKDELMEFIFDAQTILSDCMHFYEDTQNYINFDFIGDIKEIVSKLTKIKLVNIQNALINSEELILSTSTGALMLAKKVSSDVYFNLTQ
ncbi:MAG: AAA family ATPase [Caldisericia bacterium]|nr:AAA family ATPase [Caldisericia bacterium]